MIIKATAVCSCIFLQRQTVEDIFVHAGDARFQVTQRSLDSLRLELAMWQRHENAKSPRVLDEPHAEDETS